MREREVEAYLGKRVKEHGGLYWKLTSPGTAGVPDRLVIIGSQVYFVELKAPGEKPRALQRVMADRLGKHGQKYAVVDSKESADQFVKEVFYQNENSDQDVRAEGRW